LEALSAVRCADALVGREVVPEKGALSVGVGEIATSSGKS
jgi:hypothetical protein